MIKPIVSAMSQAAWRGRFRAMNKPASAIAKPYLDIAERLRWHREVVEGVNQEEYAARAGLKRAQFSNWESGIGRLSIDGALALRETYGLSLDFMYAGNDDALPMTLRQAWRSRPDVKASK
ncbi:transcriptional regulator, XRE family protein [Stappia sp. 22II-S9-Z10]|nr:transcriptional regulator, XRE family protein [Stappia sp. 22II-S9-Z10]